MGKKTNKFISDIDTHQMECKKYMEQWILYSEKCAEIDVKHYDATQRMVARLKELRDQYKNDIPALNQALGKDTVYAESSQEVEELNHQADAAVKKRNVANNEIYNRLERIDSALGSFEAYINKKAKSKNPFKSKKSIPAARDYIDASKTFLENSRAFYKSIGGFVWFV